MDESFRIPGKRRDTILMQNIFVVLASPEMAAQSRFLCIVYFEISILMRWLAGKTHELKDFPVGAPPEEQWCTRLIGELFIKWVMDNHPWHVLYHVEQVKSYRQEISRG